MPIADVPITPAVEQPAAAPAEKQSAGPDIPEPVKQNPVIIAVLTGEVPGVYIRPLYYPQAYQLATEHTQDILDLGLGIYAALDGSSVLFNPAQVSEQELKRADEQGQLANLLPDYEQLSGEAPQPPPKGAKGFDTAPSPTDLLKVQGSPKTTGQAPTPKPPADFQNKLGSARVGNILPQPPVSGTAPVSGKVTRQITTPAI